MHQMWSVNAYCILLVSNVASNYVPHIANASNVVSDYILHIAYVSNVVSDYILHRA